MTNGQGQHNQNQVQQNQNQGQNSIFDNPWHRNPISIAAIALAGGVAAAAIYTFASVPDSSAAESYPRKSENIRQEWHQDGSSVLELTDGTQITMDAYASHELNALIRAMEVTEKGHPQSKVGANGVYPTDLLERIIKRIDYNKDGRITLDEIKKAEEAAGIQTVIYKF